MHFFQRNTPPLTDTHTHTQWQKQQLAQQPPTKKRQLLFFHHQYFTHAHTQEVMVLVCGAGALCNGIATPKQCTVPPPQALSHSLCFSSSLSRYYVALCRSTIAQLFWHLKTKSHPPPPDSHPTTPYFLGVGLFFTAGAHHKFCVYNNFCYIPPAAHPLFKKVHRNCVALSSSTSASLLSLSLVEKITAQACALWEERALSVYCSSSFSLFRSPLHFRFYV